MMIFCLCRGRTEFVYKQQQPGAVEGDEASVAREIDASHAQFY